MAWVDPEGAHPLALAAAFRALELALLIAGWQIITHPDETIGIIEGIAQTVGNIGQALGDWIGSVINKPVPYVPSRPMPYIPGIYEPPSLPRPPVHQSDDGEDLSTGRPEKFGRTSNKAEQKKIEHSRKSLDADRQKLRWDERNVHLQTGRKSAAR